MTSARDVLERAGQAVVGRLLDLDARVMERRDPTSTGPLDVASVSWTSELESRWSEVRGELDAALAQSMRLPETDQVAGASQGAEGSWRTCVLHWYGRSPEPTVRRFPVTASLVACIPDVQIAGFTVLGARSHIPEHRGPSRSFRYHLGIRVPGPTGSCRLRVGDETLTWEEGRSLAFDDRTPHEAWNDSAADRYVLFVQTAWRTRGAAGVLHRGTDTVLKLVTRAVPSRVAALDSSLNVR